VTVSALDDPKLATYPIVRDSSAIMAPLPPECKLLRLVTRTELIDLITCIAAVTDSRSDNPPTTAE